MKRSRLFRLLGMTIALLFLFSACGGDTGETISKEFPYDPSPMAQASLAAFGYEIPVNPVPHGEDYVIDWQDPGMETAIRLMLDKAEGDILHSDVWDIRILTICYAPAEGNVRIMASADAAAPLVDLDYAGETLVDKTFELNEDTPWVASLTDLIHFDNLQELNLQDQTSFQVHVLAPRTLDLTGIELSPNLDALSLNRFELTGLDALSACDGLQTLECHRISFESLDPLNSLRSLVRLSLTECGTLDLSPLAGLEELSVLRLYSSDLVSLEPLTQLPALKALNIASGATYPSLEPLTRTSIEYLDMMSGYNERISGLYDDMDYEPLTRIPTLYWLDVSSHTQIDGDLCSAILAGSPNLKHLDVSFTPTARELPKPAGLESYINAI